MRTMHFGSKRSRDGRQIISGMGLSILLIAGPAFGTGWISPNANNNPTRWDNETLARDSNVITYASCTPSKTGWGQALELYCDPIKCRRIRVNADYQPGVSSVRLEIRLYPSGTWQNIYEGSFSNQDWQIVTFNTTNISGARWTWNFTDTITFWLYELEFFEEGATITVPACETLDASSVEGTTVILHGNLTDDGGDLCQWRMQYGLTSSYSTNTEWVGNEVAPTHFSKLLVDLPTNTTYHFRAQVQNSAGIASGEDKEFTTGPPATGWISPSGSSNDTGNWEYRERAYDDNVATVARCRHPMGNPVWSPYIYLTHSIMICDGIEFYARRTAEFDMGEVGVLRNGAWTNVFSANFTNHVWTEAWFPKGTVTQARARFRLTSTSYGLDYELNEFKFHRLVDTIISGRFNGNTPVTLVINGVTNNTFTNFTTNVFSFAVSVGAGSKILIFYNDNNPATNNGAVVTLATGYNMTDLDLTDGELIVRNDYGSGLSNADLIQATTGDADIPYSYSGTSIIVSNAALNVPAGHTYAPGTNSLTLYSNLVYNGTLNNTSGTVTFAGNTRITGKADASFYNVTVAGTLYAPTGTMSVAGNWVNNGSFSNNSGTVNFNGNTTISGTRTSLFHNVTISGNLGAPAVMGVAGNWVNNGAFSNNLGQVIFNGNTTISGSSDTTFDDLTIAAGATLTGPSGTLTVNGNWNNAGGAYNHNNGTVVIGGTTASTNSGNTTFYNLACTTPGRAIYFTPGSTQTVAGTFTMAGDSTSQILLRSTVAGSKWKLDLPNTDQSVTYVNVRDSDALNHTVTVSGGTDSGNNNANWIFASSRYWVGGTGNWSDTNHWSLTSGGPGGASVPTTNQLAIFNSASGTGTATINVPANIKGLSILAGTTMTIAEGTNLFTVGTAGWEQKGGTYTGGSGTLTVNGTFLLTNGTFTAPSGLFSLSGNFTRRGGTYNPNGGTIAFDGSTLITQTVTNSFANVIINGELTAPAYLIINSNFVNNGTFNAGAGIVRFASNTVVSGASTSVFNNLLITGQFTSHSNWLSIANSLTNNGTFNANGGTVAFTGWTMLGGNSTSQFNNVVINGWLTPGATRPIMVAGDWINNGNFYHNDGSVIFNGASAISGTNVTVFNNFTIAGAVTAPAGEMRVAGNWVNNGAFNANGGMVTFNGQTTISGASSNQFNHVTLWGNLTAPTGTIYVAGNWINDGSFTHNNGTVFFNGTSLIGGGVVTTFKNVIIGADAAVTGPASTLNVAGNWNGSAGYYYNNGGRVILPGTTTQWVSTGGAWLNGTNNWKNNWGTLIVSNGSAGGVYFTDGFKANYFIDTVPGSTLYFRTQEEVTNVYEFGAVGGLTLQGSSSQRIILRRYGGSGTNQWELTPTAASFNWTVNYVDVQNSVNSGSSAIYPTNSLDSGNTENWFVPTLVEFGWLYAIGRDGAVTVRWKTESEVNNAGFNVYRAPAADGPYARLNPTLIRGLGNSVMGGEYKFEDGAATNGATYYYLVESVEYDGRAQLFGPSAAQPGRDSDGDGMTDDWEDFYGLDKGLDDAGGNPDGDGWTNLQEFQRDTNPYQDEGETGAGGGGGPPTAGGADLYKLTVDADGIYRLDAAYLSTYTTNLAAWVVSNIHIFCQGAAIPLLYHDEDDAAFGTNDYVEFFGRGLNTRFSGDNIYWLCPWTNAGPIMPAVGNGSGTLQTTAPFTEHFEENAYYEPELPDEYPDDDHWFFYDSLWVIGPETNTLDFFPTLSGVAGGSATGLLTVALRGLNEGTNTVRVWLNGAACPDAVWTGLHQYAYAAPISQAGLLEGTNTVTLSLIGDEETFSRDVLINWFEIAYTRDLTAANGALLFTNRAGGAAAWQVGGFAAADVRVLRVGDTGDVAVAVVTNVTVSGAGPYAAVFADNAPAGAAYALAAANALRRPAACVAEESSNLRSATNQADYLIIAYEPFRETLAPLIADRAARGLNVKVVGLTDVYDDFNFGIRSPYAIRDFLDYARQYWRKPAPMYVLFAGDTSYDYRDYEDVGAVDYLPTKMIHDVFGEVPSDNWFVSLVATNTGSEDMFVGRFPARSTNDLARMIQKTLDYEAADPEAPWARRAAFVADNGDPEYERICAATAGWLPTHYVATNIWVRTYAQPTDCRPEILAAFNSGALLIEYAGHGSYSKWAHEGIFRNEDIAALTNAATTPLVVTPTCMNGYFVTPAHYNRECMAEQLIRTNRVGAAACLSPSGWSAPPEQRVLAEGLFQAIFAEGAFEAGPAVARAKQLLLEQHGTNGLMVANTYVLFGDPALRLRRWSGYVYDTNAPAVTAVNPTNGSIAADPAGAIRVTFSKPMNDIATRTAFALDPPAAGAFQWDGNTLVFQPEAALTPFVTYTVTLHDTACDRTGHRLAADYTFAFTPTRWTAAGTIAYAGLQSGLIYIFGVATEDDWRPGATPALISQPGAYTLDRPGNTPMWLRAFRDTNGNGLLDPMEARGEYIGNPVMLTHDLNVDITLVDPDADSDGLPDWVEDNGGIYYGATRTGSNPNNADTDGDGIPDATEVNVYNSNPANADTDKDGLDDSAELLAGTNLRNWDTDGDLVGDYQELFVYGTDPLKADTDADHIWDGDELIAGTSPTNGLDFLHVTQYETADGAEFTFTWETRSNRWYDLQGAPDIFDSATWTTLETRLGDGATVTATNTPAPDLRFFWINVRPAE